MSSSFVKDCSDASAPPSNISHNQTSSSNSNSTAATGGGGGNKTVFIIVNNDTQIDQEQLSSLLASHAGNSSEVSVVQMDGGQGVGGHGGEYGGHDPTSTLLNPASADHEGYQTVEGLAIDAGGDGTSGYSELPLDAESLHQLESVLCTDEARQLLGGDPLLDMLSPPAAGGGQNGGCWRRLSPTAAAHDSSATSDSDTNNVEASEGSSSPGTGSRGAKPGGRGRGRAPPKRRSQRQQDKAERDEVTKILAENQLMLQLEREQLLAAAAAAAGGSLSSTDGTSSSPLHCNSESPINNLNIEVQVEFDHQTHIPGTNKDGEAAAINYDDGGSDDDEDESESEKEEEDEEEKEEVVSRPRGGGATRSRGRTAGRPPGRGDRGASRGRGRGRAKAAAGEESVAGRGKSRGRGTGESEEGSATGRRTAVKRRSAPPSSRARSRGRGRGSASKGKQIPVMPESEDDEEAEDEGRTTQQCEGWPSTAGVVATNTSAAAADDQIDLLEKQLSHLHGESSDGDYDEGETSFAPPRPGTMSHLRDVLTDRASEGSDAFAVPTEVLPVKKILFLKRGSIGSAKSVAVAAASKVSEDVTAVEREAAVEEEERDKQGEERGEEADGEVDDDKEGLEDEGEEDEEEADEEEEDDSDDEGASDDDYKPTRDVTNTEDLYVDASREDIQDTQEERSPKKKKGRRAKVGKKSTKPKKDENDSPRKKKKTPKKEKPEKAQFPKKDIIKKIIDKKGNIRYVKRRVVDMSFSPEKEEKSEVKPAVKKASNPQDYLKILELAQMNVESAAAAHAKKKPSPKPLPDPKNVLKKMRETMSEGGKSRSQTDEGVGEGKEGGQPKKSEPNPKEEAMSDRKHEHRKNSSSDDTKTLPSVGPATSTSPQDNDKNPNRKPLATSVQKKPKMFSAALDVPYETLKKPKFVKKLVSVGSGELKAPVPLSMSREAILSRAKQDEAQSYKDANKMLLNKLESKLGKVSKNSQVAVDLVQHSSSKKSNPNVNKVSSLSPNKSFKQHQQGQRLKQQHQQKQQQQHQKQQSSRYKEEFDDEDEELDDLEEYKPLPPVSELNIRRSKRPPKKKSFGDEMIMFDEKETLSDEDEEEDRSVKAEEDQEEEIDEDDENHHTLKRRRREAKSDEQFFFDLEVVDHLGKPDGHEDGVKEEEEEEDDEDQQSSSDEFVEEDDPERLWCVCQRPHNNRFMICCDQCEDWFHGSCVGITKAMGKQMEEAGREWVCPKCCRKDTSSKPQDGGGAGVWAMRCPADQCRAGCGKRRRVPGSLFCSDACTLAHAAASVSAATGHDQHELNVAEVSGRKPTLEQQVKNEPRVLVANTRTGQVLSGKDAPTLSELTEWLRRHPEFTLVKPSAVNSARTTPSSKSVSSAPGGARTNSESGGGGNSSKLGRVTINVSKAVAEAGFREVAPSGSQSAPITHSGGSGGVRKTILLTSVKAPSQSSSANNITAADVDEPQPRKSKNETPLKPARQYKKRSRSESESKPETPAAAQTPSAPTVHDIRRNVRKALTDSLLKRAEDSRTEFPEMHKEDIEKLVKQIEEELFSFFNKSVNIKYKSRYRSLVFNIRDSKNGGLFRQILTGAATPQKLATMTSDEMASKELAEWRQTQGKKELEAIQKHELDMISLGNTYIMKSHKGEIEIDKHEFIKDKETAPETLNQLPEEEPLLPEPVVTAIAAATSGSATQDREALGDRSSGSSKLHKSSRDSRDSKEKRKDGDRDRHRKHSRDEDRQDRKRRHSGSSRREEESSSSFNKKRHHSDNKDHKRDSKDDRRDSKDDRRDSKDGRRDIKDDRRDRKDDRRSSSDNKRDKSDRRRHDSDDRHHRDKRRDSSSGDKGRRSKHDEVSTSDDVVTNERRLELSVIAEERDGEPSSTVGPLPGELNYDESRKLLPLPPNLPTHLPPNLPAHLPLDQDDLLPPASPTLPMEDDPSYIPPYSPEAIPPQSPIPAREDTNQYMLSSPQTPPLDLSPSSTPPPLEDDGGGEYSPSAPPFSNHKKSKTSDYRPSTYSSKKRLSRSCLSKFDLPQQAEGERIAIWRGTVQMNDVAKFAATAFEVSGGSVNFTQDVPETIGVVGRISPDTVWAYIADTKKAASKEILVVRFQPTCEEEKVAYIALYSYLSSKKRYGVLGHIPNSCVKDFYIIPLASHQPIPQVLLPLDGPGFEEQRPHMLVGVVVRPKPMRIYDPFSGTWKDLPDAKLSEESSAMLSELKEASERSFTPPLPSAAAAPTPSALASSGGTAPYDPEDEEESKESSSSLGKSQLASHDGKTSSKDEEQSYTPEMTPTNTPPGAPDVPSDNEDDIVELPQSPSNKAVKRRSDVPAGKQVKKIKKSDLSREQESMLAELNRQIEEHKKELKCMQMTINSGNDDDTSTGVAETTDSTGASNDGEKSVQASENVESDKVKLDTTKINIPDNLHMILESIKCKEDEIKKKEAEILRRKNEVLSTGSGDTDMRMLLPPPQHQRVAAPVSVPPPHDGAVAPQQQPPIAASSLPPAAVVCRPAATAAAAGAVLPPPHLRGGVATPPLGHPVVHPQQMNHPSMSHPPPQQRPSAQPPAYLQPPQTQAYHHPAAPLPHHHQQVPPPVVCGVSAPPYHPHSPAGPHPHHQAALIPPHPGFDQRGPPPMVGGPPPVGLSVPPRSNYPHAAAMPPVVSRPHEYPHPPGPGAMPGGPPPRQRPAPYPDQYGPPRVGHSVREPPAASLGPAGGPIRPGPEVADGYRADHYVDRRDRYSEDRYGGTEGRYGGPPPPPGPPYEPDRHRRQSRDYHHQQQSPQQLFRGRDDAYAGYGRGGEYDEYERRGDEVRGGRGGQWRGGGGRGRREDWGDGDDRGHGWGRGGRGRR